MILNLRKLEAYAVTGIYGKNKNELPERMRFLAPDAATSYLKWLSPWAVVSDMLRSAESSLQARREGRGAQPPSYSGHNYGFSIDLDVDRSMKNLGIKTKRELNEKMAEAGWYCHRRDNQRGREDWHYNFFGANHAEFVRPTDSRTSAGLERKIQTAYGQAWIKMTNEELQIGLAKLKLYSGGVDGKLGPLSKEATRVFQRSWRLTETGVADIYTKRTLAFVTADRA